MTLAPAPLAASTSSGAALPLVALPQRELLTVNEKNIPMVRNAVAPGVHVQPLRLDIENGEWVVRATFEPARLSRCTTTPVPPRCSPSQAAGTIASTRPGPDRGFLPLRAGFLGAYFRHPRRQHRGHRDPGAV